MYIRHNNDEFLKIQSVCIRHAFMHTSTKTAFLNNEKATFAGWALSLTTNLKRTMTSSWSASLQNSRLCTRANQTAGFVQARSQNPYPDRPLSAKSRYRASCMGYWNPSEENGPQWNSQMPGDTRWQSSPDLDNVHSPAKQKVWTSRTRGRSETRAWQCESHLCLYNFYYSRASPYS